MVRSKGSLSRPLAKLISWSRDSTCPGWLRKTRSSWNSAPLSGVTTPEEAENLRGAEVAIRERDAAPLEADEYFIHQLYGLTVVVEDGAEIGRVREVIETGANEVLIVARLGQPDALIPMIHDVVQDLDIAGGRVVVRLIEGLLP